MTYREHACLTMCNFSLNLKESIKDKETIVDVRAKSYAANLKAKNKLSADFKSEDKYYIVLAFYEEKYFIDRYSLYYEFN